MDPGSSSDVRNMEVLVVFLVILHIVSSIENFGTKTSYNYSLKLDLEDNFFPTFPFDNFCQPSVHISSLYRHGSRFPSAKDVNVGRSVLKGLVLMDDRDAYKRLEAVLDEFEKMGDKSLSPAGFEELRGIGKQLKKEYYELFKEFNEGDFQYYVTSEKRTLESFKGFLEGIKPNEEYKPTPVQDDDLLRFFKACKKYKTEVKDNDEATIEVDKFLNAQNHAINQEMQSKYRNEFYPYNFTNQKIRSIYSLAGTEIASYGTSNWLVFLTQKAADLLEYTADLKNYWQKGGGHRINYLQSCVLLRHLFHHFDHIFNKTDKVKGSFYFAHAETLIPLYALMGLFNNTANLTSDNYPRQTNREFKTTHIIPFAGSIRFELRKCSVGGKLVDYIGLFMKDQQLRWPICASNWCSYEDVRNHYNKIIVDCDFEAICGNSGRELTTSIFSILIPLVVMMMILKPCYKSLL